MVGVAYCDGSDLLWWEWPIVVRWATKRNRTVNSPTDVYTPIINQHVKCELTHNIHALWEPWGKKP